MAMQLRVVGKDTLMNGVFDGLSRLTYPISGELLLVLFGAPCVSSRTGSAGTREVSGWKQVIDFVTNGRPIPHQNLRILFPDALTKLEAFIRDPLSDEPWLFEEVLSFCRVHKGKVRNCDSIEGVVITAEDLAVKIIRNNQTQTIFNHYKFPVRSGDWVCAHKGVLYHVLRAPPS